MAKKKTNKKTNKKVSDDGVDINILRKKKNKTSVSRIIMRVVVCVFSVIFILCGSGLLYIDNMYLGSINREEVKGNESFSISDLEIPTVSDVPVASNSGTGSQPHYDFSGTITQYKKQYDEAQKIEMLQDKDVTNYLFVGSDSRTQTFSGRADSNMIVSINKRTKKINITSLQRTIYVKIPKYDWFALNAAYSWGGAKTMIETVENNFRVKIDGYIITNFQGFEKIINTLGGLDLELTKAEADYLNFYFNWGLVKGMNHMKGDAVLEYARLRKIDTDFRRTERQRYIIEECFKKALKLNVVDLNNVVIQVAQQLNTDISDNDLINLGLSVKEYASYQICQKILPGQNDIHNSDDIYKNMIYVPAGDLKLEMYRMDYKNDIASLHEFILN